MNLFKKFVTGLLLALASFTGTHAASTFANYATEWYIRADGVETNGGGCDRTVTNFVTCYGDQSAAQVNVENSAITATAATTTVTFTGGYTPSANDVGNVFRLATVTGSGCTADYYVITAASGATWTLDRSIGGASCTALVGKMGGAHLSLVNHASAKDHGGADPLLAAPTVGGNTIWIRGTGGLTPSSVEYNWSAFDWLISGTNCGDTTESGAGNHGVIRFLGYPAGNRPLISHTGVMLYFTCRGAWKMAQISFKQANGFAYGICNTACALYDVLVDINGYDTAFLTSVGGDSAGGGNSIIASDIINSAAGAAAPSTYGTIFSNGGGFIYGTRFKNIRAVAALFQGIHGGIFNSLFDSNLSDSIKDDESAGNGPTPLIVMGTTIYNSGSDGMDLAAMAGRSMVVANNLVTNHTAGSTYGMKSTDTYWKNVQNYKGPIACNDWYGNTADFNTVSSVVAWALNPVFTYPNGCDLAVSPAYTNAGGGDFTTGTSVRQKGILGIETMKNSIRVDMGAVWH